MDKPILAVVAVAALVAAVVWGRSAQRLQRVWQRIEDELGPDADATVLARSSYRKELHTVTLYAVLAVASAVAAVWDTDDGVTTSSPSSSSRSASRCSSGATSAARPAWPRTAACSSGAPRRCCPRRSWRRAAGPPAWRPRTCPTSPASSSAGCTRPAPVSWPATSTTCSASAPTRIAAVIGDVTGHGIEPSITAFQAKYLLRVFLRQYRDPAQALEELNRQMSALERFEEFISICVVVFDTEAATLRVASAGHPAAWLWHDREVRPLRATGPLLMLDPDGEYTSREIPLDAGDLLLLYTDGLAEARAGEQLFGEDRVANTLRRDPGVRARRPVQDRCSRRPASSPPSR